ncbi:MAG: hypothetical protein ACHQE5_01445 [Actinomycetes bacterium]
MTVVSVGGGVTCALTRLLRPEEDPLLGVLDAWPLTVPDVLGGSDSPEVLRPTPGAGIASALERLLRPDRQVMLLAMYSLDLTGDDLLRVSARPDLPGDPPATTQAA